MEKIAGPRIDIQVDEAALQRARKELAYVRDGIARAVYNALNRTMVSTRAKVSRDIKARINLPIKEIKSRLLFRHATLSSWVAEMWAGDAGFDLVKHFGAKDLRLPGFNYGGGGGQGFLFAGVRVNINKGGSILPRAFIRTAWGSRRVLMRMYGGGVGAKRQAASGKRTTLGAFRFESSTGRPTLDWRTGQIRGSGRLVGRMPIVTIKGPSLRDILVETPAMVASAVRHSKDRLTVELDGQVRRLTKQNAAAGPPAM